MLVVAWGWSYWFGLIVGLLAAVLLGVLVEGLIIRRFFTAPRLVLTVATIGLSQLLAGAGLFLPAGLRGPVVRHPPAPAVRRQLGLRRGHVQRQRHLHDDRRAGVPAGARAVPAALDHRHRHRGRRRAGRPGLHARHPGQAPAHRRVGGGLGARLPRHVPAGGGGGPADRRGAGPDVPRAGAGRGGVRPVRAVHRPSRPPPSASASSTRP